MSKQLDQCLTPGQPAELAELCAQATELVRGLPGPVRRVSLRTAGHGLEIEWAATGESAATATLTAAADVVPPEDDVETHVVRAPLVGTFYAAPQPGADPFAALGDVVEPGQTLAIVEAMKLMNHVAAEVAGRIVEILVSDGVSVEFDQPLMRIAVLDAPEAA